jgi:ribonuclease Z
MNENSSVRRCVARVIFLGTGDPLNEQRAQTSLAVPLSGSETMLIDASSGTILLRQLEAAGIPLETVRHLFVTHLHFDHVGGLAPLLTAMASLPKTSLSVHATPETLSALKELLGLIIPGVEDWLGKRLIWRELAPGKPVRADDAEVTPFEVNHGLRCVGFRIIRRSSSMTFSADTRPCRSVIEHARETDLLVHEAYGPKATPSGRTPSATRRRSRRGRWHGTLGPGASSSPTCARAGS